MPVSSGLQITVLELWMQIHSTSWVHLLSLVVEETFPIAAVSPWRDKQTLTAGLVAQWLRMEFTGLAFRDGFNRKPLDIHLPGTAWRPKVAGVVPLSVAASNNLYRFSLNYATNQVTQGLRL